MDVVVTGIGLASALGNLQETWNGLLQGRSGLRMQQPFVDLPRIPLGTIGAKPSRLRDLTQEVLQAALVDAQLAVPLPDCGVVIGSSRGNQALWEDLLQQAPDDRFSGDDFDWLETLPQSAASIVARSIQSHSIVLSPMAACATGLWAIAQGAELIRQGQYQRVIAGAIEAPITPLTIAGFRKMGALAQTGGYPFDRDREGLVLGEGGALLVLESRESAAARRAKIYGQVLEAGLTADAYHLSAPDPTAHAAISAVKQCCDRSGLSLGQIDYIHAHGTGTQLNDQNEAYLLNYLGLSNVPVSSTKGATGHTLGASGAIGAALCLMDLTQQTLPPSIGLKTPAFDLNFVRQAESAQVNHCLCFSFGFGGQNAVIALAKDDRGTS